MCPRMDIYNIYVEEVESNNDKRERDRERERERRERERERNKKWREGKDGRIKWS